MRVGQSCWQRNTQCSRYYSSAVKEKCYFIAEFGRVAKIRKIAVYRFLISPLVPELQQFKKRVVLEQKVVKKAVEINQNQ